MLPRNEIDTRLITVVEAVDLADAGEETDGFQALLAGLHRTRELQENGLEWAGELVRRWQEAVQRSAERYRIGRA
jgi:hypothetical protein